MLNNVSIIIISYNEEFAIQKCLNSLALLSEKVELVFVNCKSSDTTLEQIIAFAKRRNNVQVFEVENDFNAAYARNIGILNSRNEYIMFLDGDIEFNPEFIINAVSRLNSDNSVGAVIGPLSEIQYSTNYLQILETIPDRLYFIKETASCLGGVFLTKKSILSQVGIFNIFYKYQEDRDLSLRIAANFDIIKIDTAMGVHHTVPYNLRTHLSLINNSTYLTPLILSHLKKWRAICSLLNHDKLYSSLLLMVIFLVLSPFNLYFLPFFIFMFVLLAFKFNFNMLKLIRACVSICIFPVLYLFNVSGGEVNVCLKR